jgi:predicted amidohydrolase YtcJ
LQPVNLSRAVLPFLVTLVASAQQTVPDMVLLNAKVFTSDTARPYVEALAIRGERIAAVGQTKEIAALAGKATKRIDLGGRTVIPGINDAHVHLSAGPDSYELQFGDLDPDCDRTARDFVKALDATGGKQVWSKRRLRIEHGDGITPDLIGSCRELGVVVVQNPIHFSTRDVVLPHFGAARIDRLFPFRSLLDAGIPLALGSDGPPGPTSPFINILFATTDPMRPQEAITREQAVIAYTRTAAYAEFTEKDKGTLEPGKLADLAVLSQDILRFRPPICPRLNPS